MVDWNEIRNQFPAIKKSVYLNTASASPVSKVAVQEAKRYYDDVLIHGDSNWEKWLKKTEIIREKVAKFINADKSEIAFMPNTSSGMNIVAEMLEGKGEVVTMNDEFPSSTIPWMNRGFKINWVMPENNIYSIDAIDSKITEKIKILVTSHVQYCTGFKQDLIELGGFCKRKDLIYVVNATQSIGAMPIDVKKANIDFLVFSSVKWLLTGESIGAIYISKKLHKKIKWPVAGWMSVKNAMKMNNRSLGFKNSVSRLEVGGPALQSIFVLGKTIDFLSEIDKYDVEKRIYELNDYLVGKLSELDIEIITPLDKKYRSGITVIKMKNAEELVRKLSKKKVIVSARKNGLRISVHIYNNENDIDKFIRELKPLL